MIGIVRLRYARRITRLEFSALLRNGFIRTTVKFAVAVGGMKCCKLEIFYVQSGRVEISTAVV